MLAICILFIGAKFVFACGQDDCPRECCICEQPVDEDGDRICDLCGGCIPKGEGEDTDGDGIPNGQDDDYEPPHDGDGAQKGKDTSFFS